MYCLEANTSNGPLRLLLGTVQKSAKGLTAAACYPGYILLRNELAREEQTFVMIDRHFCPHGMIVCLLYSTKCFQTADELQESISMCS